MKKLPRVPTPIKIKSRSRITGHSSTYDLQSQRSHQRSQSARSNEHLHRTRNSMASKHEKLQTQPSDEKGPGSELSHKMVAQNTIKSETDRQKVNIAVASSESALQNPIENTES